MALLTYNQIKKEVGDAWALIANPVLSEKTGKLLKGELIYFNENKEKVQQFTLNDVHTHITVRYFGKIPENQIFILNIRWFIITNSLK